MCPYFLLFAMRRLAAAFFPRRDSLQDASPPASRLSHKNSLKSWFKSVPTPLAVALPTPKDDSTDLDSSIDSDSPSRLITTTSSSSPFPSSSPFARSANSQLVYPRSANPPHSLPLPQTLRIAVLKRRLYHRLRTNHPSSPLHHSPSDLDAIFPPPTTIVSPFSPGIARWIARPCFEHRCAVYQPTEDGFVLPGPVTATDLAVADLEFSDTLYAMAEFDGPQIPPSFPLPFTNVNNVSVSVPIIQTDHHRTTPIPDRPLDPPHQRGVHFIDDDKEDVVPLGYILRQKQARQAKAIFLKAEADRRAQQEKHRLETERLHRVNELKARERKKKIDDEKAQCSYAEQVVAARIRSESARAGGVPSLKCSNAEHPGSLFPTSASSLVAERNNLPPSSKSLRQVVPTPHIVLPRREASEPNLATVTKSKPFTTSTAPPPPSRRDSSNSPDSTRTPSLGSPPTPSSLTGPPTPNLPGHQPQKGPSPEEVRAAMTAAANNNWQRTLFHTNNSSNASLTSERMLSWAGTNPTLKNMIPSVLTVPMLPPLPVGYPVMDSPLLPPAAPFMLQNSRRLSVSQNSGSGSSRGNLSRDSSQERLAAASATRRVGSSSQRRGSHPRSNSYPEHLNSYRFSFSPSSSSNTRSRLPNDLDTKRTNLPIHPGEKSSRDHPQPAYSSWRMRASQKQQESPWTGVPTQTGKLPNGIVHSQSTPLSQAAVARRRHAI